MSLDSQIDNIQTGIQDVRTKLSIHAKTAEVTISKDHADIASSLRQSVEAVESTYKQIEHLGQQDDLLILDAADEYCSYVDPFADENSPLAESKALIARSYDNLSEHFNRLASLADDAPEHVMSLNRELADLEAQIERLKAKLDLTSKRAQVDIESARAKLAIGRLDRTDAEKKLREASAEVAALNARKQDNQDNRQLLRAVRRRRRLPLPATMSSSLLILHRLEWWRGALRFSSHLWPAWLLAWRSGHSTSFPIPIGLSVNNRD